MANISLKKAALINAASKYTSILFSIVFSMILARILIPEDYGIVAVTLSRNLFRYAPVRLHHHRISLRLPRRTTRSQGFAMPFGRCSRWN